jgi:hypothetical protein
MAKFDPDPVLPGGFSTKRRVSEISDAYLAQWSRRNNLAPGLRAAIDREVEATWTDDRGPRVPALDGILG